MKSVLVMLSAYNGSEYIIEQINSILEQAGVEVHLVIRDDCSKDDTVEVIKKRFQGDKRVELIASKTNVGCALSFMSMLFFAPGSYDYYAFSDQDDIWKKDKLEHAVSMLEANKDESQPALYCCNREEVDSEREFLYTNVAADKVDQAKSLEYFLFVRNIAAGNTMVFSRSFLEILQQAETVVFPLGFYHDFWVHLVAVSLDQVTIIYDLDYCGLERRVTGSNLAGINREKKQSVSSLFKRFKKYAPHSMKKMIDQVVDKYGTQINTQTLELYKNFQKISSFSSRVNLIIISRKTSFDSLKGRMFSLYKIITGIV